ncbi:SHOCT domain-containing protein [Microbacterium saperdae]
MPFIPRIGRPGLLGLAARTAVVAGTATAVSGAVAAHRRNTAQSPYDAAQFESLPQSEPALPGPVVSPAPPQAPSPGDLVTELQNLMQLRTQGMLTDAEFTAAKARLLS